MEEHNSNVKNCMEPKNSFRSAFFVRVQQMNKSAMAKQCRQKCQRQCKREDTERRKKAEIERCTHENKEILKTTHK